MSNGWIGVDLDGTLAVHMGVWDGSIGPPIYPMVDRVRRWIKEGREVRIITARVARTFNDEGDRRGVEIQRELIEKWLVEHIGQVLVITSEKDYYMIELWDDRAIRVVTNTGERCCDG